MLIWLQARRGAWLGYHHIDLGWRHPGGRLILLISFYRPLESGYPVFLLKMVQIACRIADVHSDRLPDWRRIHDPSRSKHIKVHSIITFCLKMSMPAQAKHILLRLTVNLFREPLTIAQDTSPAWWIKLMAMQYVGREFCL